MTKFDSYVPVCYYAKHHDNKTDQALNYGEASRCRCCQPDPRSGVLYCLISAAKSASITARLGLTGLAVFCC